MTTTRLGYRQRALLAILREARQALPTGYLSRAGGMDMKTTCVALRGLEARELVVHVGFGKWAAAA